MKLSLNVMIARSATMQRCITGGASWKLMFLALSSLWKAGEVSLSSLMYDGLTPLMSRCSWRSVKTLMNSLSDI